MSIRALGILLVVLLACAAGITRDSRAVTAMPTLRLATYFWPGSFWIDVALAKGWFAEAGLHVERTNAHGRYFETLGEVATGAIDGMGFTEFDLIQHVSAGENLVGILAIDYSTGAEALVARPGISRLADLKGKRLALYRGTYLEYLLDTIADREELDLSQVTLVDRSQVQAIADFQSGQVDAVFVWDPYVGQALAAGGATLFSTADFPGLTYSLFAVRRDTITQHPEQMTALINVWHRAEHFIQSDPEATCAIIATAFNVSVESVHGLMRSVRALEVADNARAFSYAAGYESLHGSWRRMNDFMVDEGLAIRRVESSSHLDSTFVRRLE